MPTKSPLRSLALARARFREQHSSNGEFSTPLRSDGHVGGGGLETFSSAPPIVVGDEIAYVRDPKALCLSVIGSGSTCCLNGSDCPVASHKAGGSKFEADGPFFMELHQGQSAKGFRKGYCTSCLMLKDEVDEKVVDSLVSATSSQWKAKFEELQDVPAEELSCSVLNRLEMLQQTAIKLKPNLAAKSLPEEVDATPMGSLLKEELLRVEAIAKEMLNACEDGQTHSCPMHLDMDISDKTLQAVSDEAFMQLYKLLDMVGSLISVTSVVQEEAAEFQEVKDLVNGLSLLVRGLKSSIGQRPSQSTFAPDLWSALLDLEGKIDAHLAIISNKVEDNEKRTDALFQLLEGEDDLQEMGGCGDVGKSHTSGEHDCCSHCTQHFKILNEAIDELKVDNSRLHRKLVELDTEEVSSDQVGTFSVQGIMITSRQDVSALMLKWFPDSTDLEPSFFPTPHLLWNLVWSSVSNNQNGMKIPFSDGELLKMKINKRSAEAFYSAKAYLPQFMTADSLPVGFAAKSSKSERTASQAFKSIPTALDFGRSGDSDYLHGKFRKALKDVGSQYRNYLEQKLFSHPDSKCFLIAKQCLDDSVDHISHVLEFMEDQNYRNVRSFGQEKKVLAWNLVSACVRDVYEVHFKSGVDLVVSKDLSDLQEMSVDVTYCALALNQLVKELNRIGLKHHPSVSSSQLRFVMESYAESGDDSAKVKKLEKENEKLVDRLDKLEDEMDKLKRKHGDLASVVNNMKKKKRKVNEDDE